MENYAWVWDVHYYGCCLFSEFGAGRSQEDLKPQILVDQARVTLNNFVKQADMEWFQGHLKNSKGVFIVPQLLKAGFIFGGSGGRGVVLIRDAKQGSGVSLLSTAWAL